MDRQINRLTEGHKHGQRYCLRQSSDIVIFHAKKIFCKFHKNISIAFGHGFSKNVGSGWEN
jgi:hypothetical protein